MIHYRTNESVVAIVAYVVIVAFIAGCIHLFVARRAVAIVSDVVVRHAIPIMVDVVAIRTVAIIINIVAHRALTIATNVVIPHVIIVVVSALYPGARRSSKVLPLPPIAQKSPYAYFLVGNDYYLTCREGLRHVTITYIVKRMVLVRIEQQLQQKVARAA